MSSSDFTELDLRTLDSTAAYKLLIGAIIPRPIAFVSTINSAGVGNLAPFSFFNGVCSAPPSLVFSITRKNDGTKKDTLRNIEENGQFVVNTVSESMAKPMNECSADYPYGVDEMKKVGLTPLLSTLIRPARVKESPVQMECELIQTVEIGNGGVGSATLVIGKILKMHILTDAYESGKIKLEKIQPLARLAGASYGRIDGVFELPRPKADG
jgi:flavin reductase (DIM6/NTAB) family NADH-FMN oxidoreductase RutF